MDDHKLFVGNMAARITQRDLWRFFSPYGPIDECAKFHESYAFVRFVNAEDAQRAREQTHGAMLKGRKLKVEFAATMNKNPSKTSNSLHHHPQLNKSCYVQPLRRTANLPIQPKSFEPEWFSSGSSTSDDFLRWAGIDERSNEDFYEFYASPRMNTPQDSRFFPRTDFTPQQVMNSSLDFDIDFSLVFQGGSLEN